MEPQQTWLKRAKPPYSDRSTPGLAACPPINHIPAEAQRSRSVLPNRNRPILPLLPKPPFKLRAKPVAKQQHKTNLPTQSGPCGIALCDKPSCHLQSHRRWHAAQYRKKEEHKQRVESSADATNYMLARRSSPEGIHKTIAKSGGFPSLPIDDQEAPILRQLFHDFFVKVVDRLHTIVVPPGSSIKSWMKRRQEELFNNALSSPTDCFNLIGTAHNYLKAVSTVPHGETAGIIIQGNLMKLLRSMLRDYKPGDHAQKVLSIIFTLVIADLTAGRRDVLRAHRKAMARIVDSCGGIHNTGPNLPFTVNLDRTIAIVCVLPPLYSRWEYLTLPLQRAPRYPYVYGSFFSKDERRESLDEDIVTYCFETCRAVEILEGEKWIFNHCQQDLTPEMFYLYYLRDRLANKFAHLQERFAQTTAHGHCILLAAKIVEYTVLMDNYVAAIPLVLAERLRAILSRQNLREAWVGWEDVLTWLLFVLICMPSRWEGKSWVIDLCRETLRRIYGPRWADVLEWRRRAATAVKSLVWSTTRFDEAFNASCAVLSGAAEEKGHEEEVAAHSARSTPEGPAPT